MLFIISVLASLSFVAGGGRCKALYLESLHSDAVKMSINFKYPIRYLFAQLAAESRYIKLITERFFPHFISSNTFFF